MIKTFLTGALALGSLLALASSANALTLAPIATGDSIVSKTAGIVCGRDDRGWHYMRGDRRIVCRPARPRGRDWGWHTEGGRSGWYHRRDRRWN